MNTTKYTMMLCLVFISATLTAPAANAASKTKKHHTSLANDDFKLTLSSKPYSKDPNAAYVQQICPPQKTSSSATKKQVN